MEIMPGSSQKRGGLSLDELLNQASEPQTLMETKEAGNSGIAELLPDNHFLLVCKSVCKNGDFRRETNLPSK